MPRAAAERELRLLGHWKINHFLRLAAVGANADALECGQHDQLLHKRRHEQHVERSQRFGVAAQSRGRGRRETAREMQRRQLAQASDWFRQNDGIDFSERGRGEVQHRHKVGQRGRRDGGQAPLDASEQLRVDRWRVEAAKAQREQRRQPREPARQRGKQIGGGA